MYLQPSTTLQNSTPKWSGRNPGGIFQEALCHRILVRTSSSYQVFDKLLWKPREDASQKSSRNQLSRSSDAFSTISTIFNGGDWGCNVRVLETIIVLILLIFNFISQRSHHSLTLPRSRFRDSATLTQGPVDGRTAIKVD